MIFLNARSNAASSVSAPTSSAVSMNRFDCSGSSGFVGLRGMIQSPFSKGNLSCRGSSRQRQCRLRGRSYRSALAPIEQSSFICEATTARTLQGKRRAVDIVNAKSLTMAVPKIEFIKIAVQVRLADVLIHAIDAALQDRKEAFDALVVMMRLPSRRAYSSLLWLTDWCDVKFQPISANDAASSVHQGAFGDAWLSRAAPRL